MYPVFVGLAGDVTFVLYFCVISGIGVPPFVLKWIVYWFIVHNAIIVWSYAGIVAGIGLSQPVNVYPVFVGLAGGVTFVL